MPGVLIETLIVQLKNEHSSWGAPKIREKLRRLHSEITLPAISTVHAILAWHGLASSNFDACRDSFPFGQMTMNVSLTVPSIYSYREI